MHLTMKQRLPGLVLTLVGGALLLHTFDEQYTDTLASLQHGPVFFPRIVLVCWLLVSVSSIFYLPKAVREEKQISRSHGKAILLALLLLGYFLSFAYLGFLLATFVLCILSQWLLGYAHKGKMIIWSGLIAAGCWATFEFIIGITLPSSIIF